MNTSKTKIKKKLKNKATLNLTLCMIINFKYLGVKVFKNGKWFQTQKSIAQRSLAALHNLFIVFNQIDLTAKINAAYLTA